MTDATPRGRIGRKVRVAVLFGGQSDEHDVSLRSARTIIDALDPDKYEVALVGITRDGRWISGGDPFARLSAASRLFAVGAGADQIQQAERAIAEVAREAPAPALFGGEIDVVFPALHGPMGEDGTVQGLLELTGLPYVGAGVLGSAVAMDKAVAKTLLSGAGLPQVGWLQVTRNQWAREPEMVASVIADRLGYPCFAKPANMGSSVGVVKVHGPEELRGALETAFHYDRKVLVEEGIDARELEVSVLGNDDPMASVAGEIVPCNEFYDYEAKYIDDRSELIIPARIDPDSMLEVQELAIAAFRALDLAGMARVDFFLDRRTDRLFVNEVNTIPGFTSISMYPRLWAASGLPLPKLVDRLIELALERARDRPRRNSL